MPNRKKTNDVYLQYMDSLLFTYSKIENSQEHKAIEAGLTSVYGYQMSDLEISASFEKLQQDGFLKKLESGSSQITMKGFMFSNAGGYVQQEKDVTANRTRQEENRLQTLALQTKMNQMTLILAIATGIPAFLALCQILWWCYENLWVCL